MPTFQNYFKGIKREIEETDVAGVDAVVTGQTSATLIDVREQSEYVQGYIPGALWIPRGFLEQRIESAVPRRDDAIVLYCAGGTRSALAAKTLTDLGYENVESASPGFVRWKDLGFPMETPPSLTDAQRDRYSRHLLLPEVGDVGQAKLLKSKVLLLGAGGLGSPAALYLAAAGVGTLGLVDADMSTRPTSSGRSSTRRLASARRRSTAPRSPCVISTPTSGS